MSVLRSLLGWLVEPASERATVARHGRRMSREALAIAAREKRERKEEKRRDAEEATAERERDRAERRQQVTDARQERRDREDRARAERAYQRLKKKNPKAEAGGKDRLNAGDRNALETAHRMSQQFHGNPDQVVELDADERRLPRYAVVVGDAKKIAYEAPAESKRAGILWEHESGDRGEGKPRSGRAPLLLADPETKVVFSVKNKSPMRFSSKQGLIG